MYEQQKLVCVKNSQGIKNNPRGFVILINCAINKIHS